MTRLLSIHSPACIEYTAMPGKRIVRSRVSNIRHEGISGQYSVKYVLGGQENYQIRNRWWKLRAGEWIIVQPGTRYGAKISEEHPADGLCLYFDNNEFERMAASLSSPLAQIVEQIEKPGPHPSFWPDAPIVQYDASLRRCMSAIATMADHQLRSGGTRLSDCCMLEVAETILMACYEFSGQSKRLPQAGKPLRDEILRRLRYAVRLIHDAYYLPLDLQQLADEAGISTYHFSRLFRAAFGMPPMAYLIHWRIQQARQMLLNTPLQAGEIAIATGFTDQPAFNKTFRRLTGTSPQQYRNSKK